MAFAPENSVQAFEQAFLPLRQRDTSLIQQLFGSVISFYRTERALGLAETDSDMLLFQYGVHDWGLGSFFEVDLTRQFIELGRIDDDHIISQFHLTCYYPVEEGLVSLGGGNCWCRELSGLDRFAEWIKAHPVLTAVECQIPAKTSVTWELV